MSEELPEILSSFERLNFSHTSDPGDLELTPEIAGRIEVMLIERKVSYHLYSLTNSEFM